MRAQFREWFNTIVLIAAFAGVGLVALSAQVKEYRNHQASDAALSASGATNGVSPSSPGLRR